jgi:DNA-directed RNA polymerase subunit RPC12/RpoP
MVIVKCNTCGHTVVDTMINLGQIHNRVVCSCCGSMRVRIARKHGNRFVVDIHTRSLLLLRE